MGGVVDAAPDRGTKPPELAIRRVSVLCRADVDTE
jgi:hypothetical protein